MIKPKDAEKRTREIITEYINECGCENQNHIRQVLIKLISMASHAIVATNSLEQAINVLQSTSEHLRKNASPQYKLELTENGHIKIVSTSIH
ncbi:hypothetical protein [Shewanella xiamenensis]|uniref:hypothetical protein n=1 Tax=Shewanella xiamenensis TaxID=332186 RepID=UPI000849A6B8|nr:hypothetical protein [Shewanella xiamenensis]ODR86725.1 hypothetical protein ABT47_16145 [Shewanella xiamenensis]